MKLHVLLRSVSLLKFMLNLLYMIDIQRGELCVSDFMKLNTMNIGLRSDAFELISVEFGVMLDTNKLFILIRV